MFKCSSDRNDRIVDSIRTRNRSNLLWPIRAVVSRIPSQVPAITRVMKNDRKREKKKKNKQKKVTLNKKFMNNALSAQQTVRL